MRVDKFGRYAGNLRLLQGLPRVGFELTEDGNFDMKDRILRRVDDPVEHKDAVNLKTVESTCLVYQPSSEKYHAKGRPVGGLGTPRFDDEAVTKRYLSNNTIAPVVSGAGIGNWDCKNKRICNVNGPAYFSDAVNLDYIIRNTCNSLKIKGGPDVLTAGARKIIMVKNWKDPLDAVNHLQLKAVKEDIAETIRNRNIYSTDDKGAFNAGKRQICFVAPGVYNEDAVTVKQLRERIEHLARSIEQTFGLSSKLSTEPMGV